jgi:predicted porin
MEIHMQVKLLAAALFTSLPLLASAQSSVTVYGVVDAAIAREDSGATDGSRTVLNSGNQSSNRIGFRGVEDIGNGLKAVFNLEAGLALDTGAGDSALFGRRAVVGLETAFGAVTLGREYTPISDVAGATDINGQGFYGTNLSSFNAGRLTRRISNSVSYRSSAMGGFKLGLGYGLGETSTGPSQNLMGVSGTYAIGDLYLGAAYHTIERQVSGDDKEMIFGAAYKIGAVDLKGNYMAADPTGANNKYEQVNLGASYGFGANKVYANLQHNELENGAKGKAVSVAYSYTLSKRTNVYASYATLSNNATGLFGLNAAGANITPPAGAAGSDPSGLALGLRHSF